jgi:hypothetical protein
MPSAPAVAFVSTALAVAITLAIVVIGLPFSRAGLSGEVLAFEIRSLSFIDLIFPFAEIVQLDDLISL